MRFTCCIRESLSFKMRSILTELFLSWEIAWLDLVSRDIPKFLILWRNFQRTRFGLEETAVTMTTHDNDSSSTLDQAAMGEILAVLRVDAPAESPDWGRWLEEIGFIAGEQVRLMAKAIPGGDPMVVRVGQSTFALRRAEAACVSVTPVSAEAAAPLKNSVAEGVGA